MIRQGKIILFLILLFWGLVPLAYYPDMMWALFSSKEILLKLMVSLTLGITLLKFLFTPKFQIKISGLDIFVILRPLSYLILFLLVKRYQTVPGHLEILIYLTIFYFLVQSLFSLEIFEDQFEKILKYFLWIVVFVCLIESAVGLLQYTGRITFIGEMVFESRVSGTLGNVNFFGGYTAAAIPYLLGLFLLKKKNTSKGFIFLILILTLYCLILTKSRGAWVGLFFGIIIFYLPVLSTFFIRIKNRITQLALVFTLIIIITLGVRHLYLLNRDSAGGRLFLWKVTAQMITDYPLVGIGYGNYQAKYLGYQARFFSEPDNAAYYDYAADIRQAHNEYLHVFAETGLLGLFIFLIPVILFFKSGLKLQARIKKKAILIRLVLASMTVIIIHGLFDCPLFSLPILVLFMFNLAVFSFIEKKETTSYLSLHYDITKRYPFYGYLLKVIALVLLVLCILNVQHAIRQAIGYRQWAGGMNNVYQKDFKEASTQYEQALLYLQNKGELHFHLAGAYLMSGQYKAALPEYEKARLNFDNKNIYLSRAMTHIKLGQHSLAIKDYQRIIEMYPNLLYPRLALSRLYLESGKLEEGIRLLRSILEINPKIVNERTHKIKNAAHSILEDIGVNITE
jgi:O-antigen polymerase